MMITDFCVICGTKEKLHNHHIVPRARGGGNEPTNMLTVCIEHHERIHQVRPGRFNKMSENQAEGIKKAKERGVYKGRKPSVDVEKVKLLKESGLGASAIAKELGIGRASVYRALDTSVLNTCNSAAKKNPYTWVPVDMGKWFKESCE